MPGFIPDVLMSKAELRWILCLLSCQALERSTARGGPPSVLLEGTSAIILLNYRPQCKPSRAKIARQKTYTKSGLRHWRVAEVATF